MPPIEEIEMVLGSWAPSGLSTAEAHQIRADLERVAYMDRYARALGKGGLVLGGGYVINFLALAGRGEPPRFTFDVDTATERPTSKAGALRAIAAVNRMLVERGLATSIEVGDRRIYFGLLEHDVERDVLPFLLPLRAPIVTRWSGIPLWRFLARRGIELPYRHIEELRSIALEVLGVDEPKVDYLRVGVSINLAPPIAQMHGLPISEISWQLSKKLGEKLVKPLVEGRAAVEAHDMAKAMMDLRAVEYYGLYEPADCAVVERAVGEAARLAAHFWSSHHYILVRRRYSTPVEVAAKVLTSLKKALNC